MFTARYGLDLYIYLRLFLTLKGLRYRQDEFTNYKPSGYYMYHQFNIQPFYVLPTQCIYVFCVDLRANSGYFPIQHELTGLYNRDGECLLRGTDKVFKYY